MDSIQRKIPKGGALIREPEKVPVRDDSDKYPPTFSFNLLKSPYCISNLGKNEKAAFADRLRKMSELTWRQLREAPREKLGSEQIAFEQIKDKLPKDRSPDEDYLAFRFKDRKTCMIGVRERRLFHVLLIDAKAKLLHE